MNLYLANVLMALIWASVTGSFSPINLVFGFALGAVALSLIREQVGSMGYFFRARRILSLMLLFTLGNLVASIAPGYASLMAARVLTGLAHGVFFSIGSTIATSLVPKEKAASAIALMFTGLTVALVTGVPLGTWIGQQFGWQSTFLAVASLGVIAMIGSAILVPKAIGQGKPASLASQFAVLRQPRLLLVYAITTLGYGGSFIAFTYLAPILQDVAGFAPSSVSLVMLVYGVSVAAGNIWGGRLADRKGPVRALQIVFALLAAVLPAPKSRSASKPTARLNRRAASIMDGAATIRADGRAACFED